MVIIALLTALGLVGLDQLFKYLTIINIKGKGAFSVIDDILSITYVENRGAAFSIMQDRRWFLIGITSIVLVGLVVILLRKKIKQPFLIWALSLIVAGGFGNLIDRIFRGYVVDYIHAEFIKNFAIFNFADCLVVVGTAMVIFYIILYEPMKSRKAKETVQLPEASAELAENDEE